LAVTPDAAGGGATTNRDVQPMAKVLIVEDEAFIAWDLGTLVAEATGAETCLAATARAGNDAREAGIDFALLDVNVSDGTTFELAHRLISDNVPFAFVSARDPAFLPADLCVRGRGGPHCNDCRPHRLIGMGRTQRGRVRRGLPHSFVSLLTFRQDPVSAP
jgi:hypothetical protein